MPQVSVFSDGLVSILVLMEEALRRVYISYSDILKIGFNPCFNGRGVKTREGITAFRAGVKFQSLF